MDSSLAYVLYLSVQYPIHVTIFSTGNVGPNVDDQAVSLSDDGTTIIIDFFSFVTAQLNLTPSWEWQSSQ
jgi:hypothetical protein